MIYMSQCCNADVNRDVVDEGTFTYVCNKCKKDCDVQVKGCGKETEWCGTKYLCGQFEDLKHSDHIILCTSCKPERKVGEIRT